MLKGTESINPEKGQLLRNHSNISPPVNAVCFLYGWLQAPWLSNILHSKQWIAKAMRQWTRVQSQSTDRKNATESSLPCRATHRRTVQPIENRAAQHYSGQPSSSQRGTETDAYATARPVHDADQYPAIFTRLTPSQLGTGSLREACQFTIMWGMPVCGPCVWLLSAESGETIVKATIWGSDL